MNKKEFLEESEVVDFSDELVLKKAKELAKNCLDKEEIAKKCFLFVRDEINHTGDYKDDVVTTYKASDVLKYKTGWCYSKAILLAALLRANGIATAFCYQRLSCSEYVEGSFCVHGLNAIYLEKYGWYRVDARGNKEGVNAEFTPPNEKLAFLIGENEYDIKELFSKPSEYVLNTLKRYKTYEEMANNIPDKI